MAEVSSKELYEFKKTLKELANKRGRGTELVSVYIPPTKQLSDVGKHMRDEMGQSANIKSKQTIADALVRFSCGTVAKPAVLVVID
mgnify:CR=1 FL=1